MQALAPELIVVAAYGKLLPKAVLELPALGCINVHSSLLPKYRGAAPINWAILNGEPETGVTIMHMAEALDAGDIILQAVTPIDLNESVEQLHDRLAVMGAELLSKAVTALAEGTAPRDSPGREPVHLRPDAQPGSCPPLTGAALRWKSTIRFEVWCPGPPRSWS